MTGKDITAILQDYEFTPQELAHMIGVGQSTMYRWLSTEGDLAIGFGTSRLLMALRVYPRGKQALGRQVRASLMHSGGLRGLHTFLTEFYRVKGI